MEELPNCFPYHLTFLPAVYEVPISPHLQKCLLFFFILAIPGCIKWQLIVVLICTSFVAKGVIFHVLIDHCVSCLETGLCRFFLHFRSGLFVFLISSCKHSLYILDTSPLSDILFENTVSHFVGSLNFLDGVVLQCTKVFNFEDIPCTFLFCCLCFWCHSSPLDKEKLFFYYYQWCYKSLMWFTFAFILSLSIRSSSVHDIKNFRK